jgi:hypothetical protein
MGTATARPLPYEPKHVIPGSPTAKRKAIRQGTVAVGYRRICVCGSCGRAGDIQGGRFVTPGGRACARCGAAVAEGLVVVERV